MINLPSEITNLLPAILRIIPIFLIICLLISRVYADPIPGPQTNRAFLQYVTEGLLAELVAWTLGAELLFRLWKRKNKEASRSESYKIMLCVMIVSFSVGLVFWWFYGWIWKSGMAQVIRLKITIKIPVYSVQSERTWQKGHANIQKTSPRLVNALLNK